MSVEIQNKTISGLHAINQDKLGAPCRASGSACLLLTKLMDSPYVLYYKPNNSPADV